MFRTRMFHLCVQTGTEQDMNCKLLLLGHANSSTCMQIYYLCDDRRCYILITDMIVVAEMDIVW